MKLEVLKFYANWCGPCKTLSQRLEGEDNIKEINVDEDHATAVKYRVRNIPTLVFLADGNEAHRSTGLITKHEYELIIDKIKKENKKLADMEVKAEVVTNLKKEK